MHGFQLWANLPSQLKMTTPRYQDVKSKDIAEETDDDGTKVRVIIGEFWGKRGPVEGIAANPCYLDVSVPPGKKKRLTIDTRANAFAYVFEGEGTFRDASEPGGVLTERHVDDDNPVRTTAGNRSLVQFGGGDEVETGDSRHLGGQLGDGEHLLREDGDEGILRYRGYPIEALAEHCDFLEVSYLLIYGKLPTATELETFRASILNHSMIHEDMRSFYNGVPRDAHPMAILLPADERAYFVELGEAARRRAHQEPVAFTDDALHVVVLDMRVADDDAMLFARRHDVRHERQRRIGRIAKRAERVR